MRYLASEWCDLENRIRVRSRSLKVVLFESSGTVSYSPTIVTMAVSVAILEINVKNVKKLWFRH